MEESALTLPASLPPASCLGWGLWGPPGGTGKGPRQRQTRCEEAPALSQ